MAAENSGIRAGMLVSTDWLAAHLHDPALRIVDMRGQVATRQVAPGEQSAVYRGKVEAYRQGHIPNALFLDWTRDIVDLEDPIPAQAARPEQIASALGQRGIGDEQIVVAYDDTPTAQFATRLWWLLRYYGHERVMVLDGGLPKWQGEGRPLATESPTFAPATFTPRPRPELRVEAVELLALLGNPDVRLLDARDANQYTGATKRGKRGGHIPGAINLPREAMVDERTGTFRTDAALDDAFHDITNRGEQRIVAYCNGGVAATSLLFALALHGYPLARLANYDGSWNEWGNRDDVPVRTGAEP